MESNEKIKYINRIIRVKRAKDTFQRKAELLKGTVKGQRWLIVFLILSHGVAYFIYVP